MINRSFKEIGENERFSPFSMLASKFVHELYKLIQKDQLLMLHFEISDSKISTLFSIILEVICP